MLEAINQSKGAKTTHFVMDIESRNTITKYRNDVVVFFNVLCNAISADYKTPTSCSATAAVKVEGQKSKLNCH